MFWSTRKIIISTGHELHHPHYAHFTAILAIGLVSKGLIIYLKKYFDKLPISKNMAVYIIIILPMFLVIGLQHVRVK